MGGTQTPHEPADRRRRIGLAAATAAMGLAPAAGAGVREACGAGCLQVGPDGPLRTLAQALRQAGPGDTIELAPGRYRGDVGVVATPGLTLRSPGRGAVLSADGRHAEGKATLVVRAPGVRIENIEFRGARVPAGNGAGIRFESGSLDLLRCRFLDNEMGVVTQGGPGMRLGVHDCDFGDAPRHDSGALHHLLYVGSVALCVVMHSRFYNGWNGHLLKSRARINRILWNELVDGDAGQASYELEFPEGGDNLVQGNRIEQSARTENAAMLSMGAEAAGRHGGRLILRDNHFVNHHAGPVGAAPRYVQLWRDRLAGEVDVTSEGNRFDDRSGQGPPR